MNKADLDELKKLIEEMLKDKEEALAEHEKLNTDDLRVDVEPLGVNPEREKAEIINLRQALDRMGQGKYGNCLSCHQPIPMERLKLVPFAERCVPCIEKVEKR